MVALIPKIMLAEVAPHVVVAIWIAVTAMRALRRKWPYSEFFWSKFSRIWTEYENLLRKSPYAVQMPGNTDQKKSECGQILQSGDCFPPRCVGKSRVTMVRLPDDGPFCKSGCQLFVGQPSHKNNSSSISRRFYNSGNIVQK